MKHMATDGDSDLLPVKDSSSPPPVASNRIELQLITKLKRTDLEERFVRIYENNLELKKEINSQDVKIKKLGTKLLRVTNERKRNGENEMPCSNELKIKMIELERENYALKDKNTVLKQQLASHSRQHMAAHRSPIHVNRASCSSRLSQRHTSVPNINEETYVMPNRRHAPTDLQLHEAEAHIAALNEAVKMLQARNEELEKQMQESVATTQQAQLSENIELIKLRRQKKQLETQLRMAEHSQKLLQQDIVRLQKENEDALQIISEKQGCIIDLQVQLDDAGRFRLENKELKAIVKHLTAERDILKERCDELLTSATQGINESNAFDEIAELRQEIEKMKMAQTPVVIPRAIPRESISVKASSSTQTEKPETAANEDLMSGYKPYNILERLALIAASNPSKSAAKEIIKDDIQAKETIASNSQPSENKNQEAKENDHKMQSENVMLRELLRGQKDLSSSLENQIYRLRQELRLKDERYRDIFQQRDLFYRLLEKNSFIEPNEKGDPTPPSLSPVRSSKPLETYTKNSPKRVPSANAKSIVRVEAVVHPEPSSNRGTFTKNSPIKTPIPSKRNLMTEAQPSRPSSAPSVNGSLKETTPKVSNTEPKYSRQKSEKISVTIARLELDEDGYVAKDEKIKALFVDFQIMSQSSDAYETPDALPIPRTQTRGPKTIQFNFSADVSWNEALEEELAKARKNGDCDVLVFNVVSEPPVEDDAQKEVECLVLGVASVSFKAFSNLEPGEELLLPIFDEVTKTRRFGTLAVKLNVPPSIRDLC